MQVQGGRGVWGCSAAPLDAAPRRMKTRGKGKTGAGATREGYRARGLGWAQGGHAWKVSTIT